MVLGCAGTTLSEAERRFFRETNPLGFILFSRNCRNPEQVRSLTGALREAVRRADAPVLIDQEGGRVARLRPPYWYALPPAARIGALFRAKPDLGREAAWLTGRIAAADLTTAGIDVNCAPVLDVLAPAARSDVIGDRAYSTDPGTVATLARAYTEGLMAGGVLPVIKHIPGHGRADTDSHLGLPVVEAEEAALDDVDLAPFKALADAPIAMTAHILYRAWDTERPATISPNVVRGIIRDGIGFDGLLLTDDISMQALGGGIDERAAASLAAGCDVVLHCNGRMDEMEAVAAVCPPLSTAAARRWADAAAARRPVSPFDPVAGAERLQVLLEPTGA